MPTTDIGSTTTRWNTDEEFPATRQRPMKKIVDAQGTYGIEAIGKLLPVIGSPADAGHSGWWPVALL
jgi:hypothetical protein